VILLRVTYRLRAHHMPHFEQIFDAEIMPVVREHGLKFKGLWRTVVGEVGEYVRWRALLADARLLKVFETTGPMVEGERFTLLEPILGRDEG
jgi:hypothetical protein